MLRERFGYSVQTESADGFSFGVDMSEPHEISKPSELDLYRENQMLRGAMYAADLRLAKAAVRVWGDGASNINSCDAADDMAEEILTLRAKLAAAEADRERLAGALREIKVTTSPTPRGAGSAVSMCANAHRIARAALAASEGEGGGTVSLKLWYREGYRRGIVNGMLLGGGLTNLVWMIYMAVSK